MKDLSSFFAGKAQSHFDSKAENQTMSVAGSQIEIGSDARNLGLRLGKEISKKKPSRATYSPSLATVRGSGYEMIPSSKGDFRRHRDYSETQSRRPSERKFLSKFHLFSRAGPPSEGGNPKVS